MSVQDMAVLSHTASFHHKTVVSLFVMTRTAFKPAVTLEFAMSNEARSMLFLLLRTTHQNTQLVAV
jgi:hypothetical protein